MNNSKLFFLFLVGFALAVELLTRQFSGLSVVVGMIAVTFHYRNKFYWQILGLDLALALLVNAPAGLLLFSYALVCLLQLPAKWQSLGFIKLYALSWQLLNWQSYSLVLVFLQVLLAVVVYFLIVKLLLRQNKINDNPFVN